MRQPTVARRPTRLRTAERTSRASDPTLSAAAVAVLPRVPRGEEARHRVGVGEVQLDPVEARGHGSRGRVGERPGPRELGDVGEVGVGDALPRAVLEGLEPVRSTRAAVSSRARAPRARCPRWRRARDPPRPGDGPGSPGSAPGNARGRPPADAEEVDQLNQSCVSPRCARAPPPRAGGAWGRSVAADPQAVQARRGYPSPRPRGPRAGHRRSGRTSRRPRTWRRPPPSSATAPSRGPRSGCAVKAPTRTGLKRRLISASSAPASVLGGGRGPWRERRCPGECARGPDGNPCCAARSPGTAANRVPRDGRRSEASGGAVSPRVRFVPGEFASHRESRSNSALPCRQRADRAQLESHEQTTLLPLGPGRQRGRHGRDRGRG